MTATYNADNSSNWLQIYENSFEAEFLQGKQTKVYAPIPVTELPIDVSSRLLAVYCTSTTFPNVRRYIGSIIQGIKTNGTFPTETVTGRGRGIYSNQTTLLEFPDFDDIYRIILNPKYYVEQLTIRVFEYVGSTYYEVENRLDIIEDKIDQML